MLISELQGTHDLTGGNGGATLEDLYQFLKSVPRKVRESNYPEVATPDDRFFEVSGIQFSQSDQAEKHEFKVYLKLV